MAFSDFSEGMYNSVGVYLHINLEKMRGQITQGHDERGVNRVERD
jgi:hypothetical protein